MAQLKKWADVKADSKYFGLLASLHRGRGELAIALKVSVPFRSVNRAVLVRSQDLPPPSPCVSLLLQYTIKARKELVESGQLGEQERSLFEETLQLVSALGWTHWEAVLRANRNLLYPPDYLLFC